MGVNKHLTHIEELVLTRGNDGANDAIDILKKVGETLNPTGVPGVTITTKWDGAPAVICGIDPSDGQFFVGTKSVFNTQDPKIAKSTSDVARMYNGELANKLTTCYQYLRPVVTDGILQGDLLFTNDKSVTNIMGKSLLSFRPNTITYAVEPNSDIGRKIANANVGIVFHTKYTGDSLPNMTASFNVKDTDFKSGGQVWAQKAEFKNIGAKANLNPTEKQQYDAAIRMAIGSLKQTKGVLEFIQSGKKSMQFDTMLKIFFNKYVKKGQNIPSVDQAYRDFDWFGGVEEPLHPLNAFQWDRFHLIIERLNGHACGIGIQEMTSNRVLSRCVQDDTSGGFVAGGRRFRGRRLRCGRGWGCRSYQGPCHAQRCKAMQSHIKPY